MGLSCLAKRARSKDALTDSPKNDIIARSDSSFAAVAQEMSRHSTVAQRENAPFILVWYVKCDGAVAIEHIVSNVE